MVTYCIVNENRENLAADIGSEEYNEWKENYKNSFFERYIDAEKSSLDVQKYYCDPDQTYQKKYNHNFFNDLVRFLNQREAALREEKALEGEYNYKFIEDEGIEVSGINGRKEKFKPFILRSDQLGFSAPSNEKKHPYDLYIMKSEDKCKAVENVSKWVAISRTIGGSFLWPMPFHKEYNLNRGGSIYSDRRKYIQDRVDLTLWEIKDWYENTGSNTIIKRVGKKYGILQIWLNHFGNFDTFVKFFCFEPFVSESNPISILNPNQVIEKLNWGDKGENPKTEITINLDINIIDEMLKTISKWTEERTEKIEKIIKEQ